MNSVSNQESDDQLQTSEYQRNSQSYQRSFRQLQEEILTFYLDLFLFYLIILFICAHIYWTISIAIPIIAIISIKILATYANCKQGASKKGNLNMIDGIDSFLQSLYYMHLLLFINDVINQIYISSICLFVIEMIFLLIKIKKFLIDQPFYKFYMVLHMVYWLGRFFYFMGLVLLCGKLENINSEEWDSIYTLQIIYFYFLFTVAVLLALSIIQNGFSINSNNRQKILISIKAQFILITVFSGIALTTNLCRSLLNIFNQDFKSEDLLLNAKFTFYFCLIYSIIQYIILILGFKIISEFLSFGHHQVSQDNITSRNLRVVPNQITSSTSQQEIVLKETKPEGVLEITVRRISSTLFKIERKERQVTTEDDNKKLKQENSEEQKQQNSNSEQGGQKNNKIGSQQLQTDEEDELNRQFKSKQSEIIEKKSIISEDHKCIVCFENEPNSILHPCGHAGMCYQCASQILKENQACSLCREPIKAIVKYQENNQTNQKKFQVISLSMLTKQMMRRRE